MLSSQFSHIRNLVFDQSSPVQPISEISGGTLSVTEEKKKEILVPNIGFKKYINLTYPKLTIYKIKAPRKADQLKHKPDSFVFDCVCVASFLFIFVLINDVSKQFSSGLHLNAFKCIFYFTVWFILLPALCYKAGIVHLNIIFFYKAQLLYLACIQQNIHNWPRLPLFSKL